MENLNMELFLKWSRVQETDRKQVCILGLLVLGAIVLEV